jgi:site-specific recombinase XerD
MAHLVGAFTEKGGDNACKSIKRSHIAAARDKMAATPAQARSFLDTMRGLFRWAVEAQHVKDDPTIGVKNPKEAAGEVFFQSGLRPTSTPIKNIGRLGPRTRLA